MRKFVVRAVSFTMLIYVVMSALDFKLSDMASKSNYRAIEAWTEWMGGNVDADCIIMRIMSLLLCWTRSQGRYHIIWESQGLILTYVIRYIMSIEKGTGFRVWCLLMLTMRLFSRLDQNQIAFSIIHGSMTRSSVKLFSVLSTHL